MEHHRAALSAVFQVHVPEPVDPQDQTATIASLKDHVGPGLTNAAARSVQ